MRPAVGVSDGPIRAASASGARMPETGPRGRRSSSPDRHPGGRATDCDLRAHGEDHRLASPGSRSPQAVLGADHPFARALDLVGVLRRQIAVTTLALVAVAVGLLVRIDWALPALTIGLVVELVLALGLAIAVSDARERVRDLVIQGAEVDVPAVARERRRLQSKRQRYALARSLEDLVRSSEQLDHDAGRLHQIYDPLMIRRVGSQLLALASDLRSASLGVRGVARVERLLTSGSSPVFGNQLDELRAELLRIRVDTAVGSPPRHGSAE
jgi:hypothetical protein